MDWFILLAVIYAWDLLNDKLDTIIDRLEELEGEDEPSCGSSVRLPKLFKRSSSI
jgi:hypothetical protein